MGFDIIYQAVPSDPAWWERIWADKEIRQSLAYFAPEFFILPHNPNFPFCPEVVALMAAYPGIESRNCHIERSWDQLHYLLSDNRRNAGSWSKNFKHAEDIGTIAVRGLERLNQDITGGQGGQIRYTPVGTVLDVVIFLDTVTEADLRRSWNPAAMYAAGVYKVGIGYSDAAQDAEFREQQFQFALDCFYSLRRFYHEVFEHNEGCLVSLD